MNFLHHRQKTRCRVLPMPQDLQELMGDISREVLRCQPSIDCTYKFIADYLDAMIKTSEKAQLAMEIIDLAILKTDEVYDQFVKCNIPKDKTDSFLNIMETTFRRFIEKKRRLKEDPRYITFHADDLFDELMRKCDLTRVEVLRSRPAIQWAYKKFVKTYLAAAEGILDTEGLYYDTEIEVTNSKQLRDMNESAVKIQKNYRGYHTRKIMSEKNKRLSQEGSCATITSENPNLDSFLVITEENRARMDKAAVTIQASFKGFNERKKLRRGTGYVTPIRDTDDELEQQAENDINMFNESDDQDLDKQAILIQKNYRGYYTRKALNDKRITHEVSFGKLSQVRESESFLGYMAENKEDLDKAAIKIQANYKGFTTRKKLRRATGERNSDDSGGPGENNLDVVPEQNLDDLGEPQQGSSNKLDQVQEVQSAQGQVSLNEVGVPQQGSSDNAGQAQEVQSAQGQASLNEVGVPQQGSSDNADQVQEVQSAQGQASLNEVEVPQQGSSDNAGQVQEVQSAQGQASVNEVGVSQQGSSNNTGQVQEVQSAQGQASVNEVGVSQQGSSNNTGQEQEVQSAQGHVIFNEMEVPQQTSRSNAGTLQEVQSAQGNASLDEVGEPQQDSNENEGQLEGVQSSQGHVVFNEMEVPQQTSRSNAGTLQEVQSAQGHASMEEVGEPQQLPQQGSNANSGQLQEAQDAPEEVASKEVE